MALKLINTSHTFDAPGVAALQVDMEGTIYKDQATVVLSGVEIKYTDEYEHNVKAFKVRVTNVIPRETHIEFDLDFNFLDDGDHIGSAIIGLVAVADVN